MSRKLDVEIKGGMFTFMSLKLYTGDIDIIDQRIADKVQQAPGFFKDTPVVVDLTELDVGEISVDADVLLQRIRSHKLVPIVASVVNKTGTLAEQVELPLIEGVARHVKRKESTEAKQQDKEASSTEAADSTASDESDLADESDATGNLTAADATSDATDATGADTTDDGTGSDTGSAIELSPMSAQEVQYVVKQPRLMSRPVRSGQQVYARDTDLIVMGQVGPGAEVIADNHIHIYGALRGRALCGVSGNADARIFCQSLEAELVSVAGNYRVLEEVPENLRGKPAQIWLENERLNIEPL